MKIEPLKEDHWPVVRRIYEAGLETGNATFETAAPDWKRWDQTHLPFCRFVIVDGADVVGWAALSAVSARQVYRGVAEVSVYVAPEHQGQGCGQSLLAALIADSERNGIWTLQASIFPENAASLALHKRQGFREVGTRERIAQLHGIWRNTIVLERRSSVV